MRKYEALFIFERSLGDESLDKAVEQAQAEVAQLGGTVLDSVVLGKKTFSRPMQKREAGVYAKLAFELDESKVDAFRGRFKHNEDVFRVQVIRASSAAPEPDEAPEPAPAAAPAPVAEAAAEPTPQEKEE